MNVLLIGGNGFIGSYLIDTLINTGHSVRVLDRGPEKYRKPNSLVDYRIAGLDNKTALWEALLGIDVVFHLASALVPSVADIQMNPMIEQGLFPTVDLLEFMAKLGIKRIIYFSSGGAVYGNSQKAMIDEDTELRPISPYGMIKVFNELFIEYFCNRHNIDSLILRPSNPYGPRQGHYLAQGVISTFLKKRYDGQPFIVFGDGHNKKDYIYIEDLVKSIYILFSENTKGVFNIGSGQGTSLNEIIRIINTVTQLESSISYVDAKEYDVRDFVLNNAKLYQITNIKPATSITEGITKTWLWLKEQN